APGTAPAPALPPAEQGTTEATTAPLQAVPAQPAAQQGFQPVGEGEIRTESLDGN
ncbi:ligand-binding protein SH3, partial [Stenotrophomonas sp. 278]